MEKPACAVCSEHKDVELRRNREGTEDAGSVQVTAWSKLTGVKLP